MTAVAAQQATSAAQPQGGEAYRHDAAPSLRAVRAVDPIQVDGRFDEATWAAAPAVSDFVQEIPLEGQPATQRTEVRIAYDDDALYIAVVMLDENPLTTYLGRRDQGRGGFDYFRLSLDSFHDHETTYDFFINPSGSIRDAVSGGGAAGMGNASWDPVWTKGIVISDEGWTLEMRLPFSQLRFSEAEEQVWGIRFLRNIHRTQERTVFPFVPTLDRGGPSRFGHLEGIRGIEPGQRLELLPYAAARAEYLELPDPGVGFSNPYRSGSDYFGDVGLDLKYRLTSNVTLDATVNPDFGQVELDPSVINLTAFETRFQEVRPFFVEGADIFSFSEGGPGGSTGRPPQLVYTRRIGRAPQGSTPSAAVFEDVDETATIVGAAKVTGRTEGGWSLGLVEAVTDREVAHYVDAGQVPGEAVVEPRTNYLVGRVRRQIQGGATRFGVIGTAVNRALSGTGMEAGLHEAAYSGGLDFAREWSNRTYRVSAALAASHVRGSPEAILATQRSSARYYQRPDADHLDLDPTAQSLSGYWAMVDLAKQSGAVRAKGAVSLTSPAYEVNDFGFQVVSDRIAVETNLGYSQPLPGSLFRNWSVDGTPTAVWNYAGDRVHGELAGSFGFQLLNYWGGGLNMSYSPSNDDDRLTRGGPIARTPARWGGFVNISSDNRRALIGRANYGWSTDDAGGWSQSVGLNFTANPHERIDLQLQPNLSLRHETAQYVAARPDAVAAGTFGARYIFADIDQTTVSLATRFNVTLSPTLSFQLYLEPFIAAGDYSQLKELAAPGTFDFLTYGQDAGTITQQANGSYTVDPDDAGPAAQFTVPNRDFSFRSLIGNAVLRWEWRQGSTLYLVWQQRRLNALSNRGPNGTDTWVGQFDLGRDVADMFGTPADDVFLVKVNYWLNP